MKHRENRPYVRRRPSAEEHGHNRVTSDARPARLASMAGRAMVERLEARQLLFSLTIAADDVDANGLGTARAIFGYALPAITTNEIVGTNVSDVVLEDFNDVVPGNIGGNTEFDDSFLRIKHNVFPPSDMRIVADIDGSGDPITGTEYLLARLADINEFMSFEFDAGEDLAVDNVDRPMTQFSIDFAQDTGQFGLPYNQLRADVMMRGEVVASFTGNALRDLNAAPGGVGGLGQGVGTFVFDSANPAIGGPMDRVVFTAIGGPSSPFQVDNIQGTFTPGNFVDIVDARIFGAEVTFRGPVGASVQILDLYGRDVVNTIQLGTPDGVDGFVLVDPDDNGIPNFNDGIGQIIFSNVDVRTSFTMWGGTIEAGFDPNASNNVFSLPIDLYQEGAGDFGFIYERGDSLLGIYDDFESAGFGYGVVTVQNQPQVVGLPPGPGAVVIGSPIVRDNTSGLLYNPQGQDPNTGDAVRNAAAFNRPDQGIIVQGGASMGRINIPGLIHGTSRFTGAINELILGNLLGSISVEGDVGMLAIAGDAGNWTVDAGLPNPAGITNNNRTESEIFIGRTVREILVGGRSLADVTVLGDLSDPKNRPALDIVQRIEREFGTPFDENSGIDERGILRAMIEANGFVPGNIAFGQDFIFGEQLFRNDTILSAEWLGSIGTGVILQGNLGRGDPAVNTVDDPADVFAFAVGDETVLFEASPETLLDPIHVRVVDEDGRTLAALDRSALREIPASEDVPRVLRFDAPAPGVYYLVLGSPDQADGNTDVGVSYRIAATGLAPTTVGMYRVAGGYGSNDIATSSTFSVIAGDVGTFRVGTGYVLGDGTEGSPQTVFNSREASTDEAMDFRSGAISIPGTLHDFTLGSDLGNATILRQAGEFVLINIGGNLGALHTGLSTVVGVNPDQGDVNYTIMNIGGNIGELDIRGAIGIDQDSNDSLELAGLNLTTGTEGGRGDIGVIRVGNHIRGGATFIHTPAGATVGAFLVSQDAGTGFGPAGDFGIIGDLGNLGTQMFSSGQGSDIRFVDFPEIDLEQSVNAGLDLLVGQSVEITDDTGGTVRITITGGGAGAVAGFVRFLPIDGSEGVAIAQIEANLAGGRQLSVSGFGQGNQGDAVTIGTINITNATAISSVNIDGSIPIDIYRIIQTGGGAFNQIVNDTDGGDIVSIDVVGINRVEISGGSLGRTEVVAYGPKLIGPDLTVQSGLGGDVGDPLGINPNTISPVWSGQIYRPTNEAGIAVAYLDDIGGPFDGFLDGLVVRSGNLAEVTVSGQIGDVILQGPGAVLTQLTANNDLITPLGGFDGIVGVIYASIINAVEIGDGMASATQSPIASVGIFAEDEIRSIDGGAVRGATISGFIIAANNVGGQQFEFGGINSITLDGGGDFVDVLIAVEFFDGFWDSVDFAEGRVFTGDINSIRATDADFFRSEVFAGNLSTFDLSNGFFDASRIQVSDNAQRISATGYRNSTISGTVLEFSANEIIVGQDLFTLETETNAGRMTDLRVDVLGSVRTSISAGLFSRVNIDVDNKIELFEAFDSIRGSSITAGRADAITALGSIVASDISISGPLLELTAGVAIVNTDMRITGRDGRLDLLSADQLISGTLTSSGPILTVQTLTGDIVLDITTTTKSGSVSLLTAARDLIVSTDISAGVDSIIAGRHIGDRNDPSVILVRGNLTSVSIPNGQLYSDIRVGGTIGIGSNGGGGGVGGTTADVTIGRAHNRAANNNLGTGSIIAFDSIGSVVINGDFAGHIRSGSGGIQSVAINNGSLLPQGSVLALDGNLASFIITDGHLLGSVHADFDILDLQVIGSLDGIFGDVGVNPDLSASVRVDSFRNQLPLGVTISAGVDGANITAGHDIISFLVTGGSIFETNIYAGHDIVLLGVTGGVFNDDATNGTGTTIVAGDNIQSAAFTGDVQDALFAAGLFFLGDDNAAGGVGANADSVHQGSIQSVNIGGSARRIGLTAGMNAGPDGLYLSGDETTALGFSIIESLVVAGNSSRVDVSADNLGAGVDRSSFNTFGTAFDVADPNIVNNGMPGVNIPATGLSFTHKGRSGTLTFTGAGQARWDSANGRVILRGTDLTSVLLVTANGGELKDFDIVSKDDASIGVLDVQAKLIGNSNIVIDRDAGTVTLRRLNTSGVVRFGGNVASITTNRVDRGHIEAQNVGTLTILGDFGAQNPNTRGEAGISVLNAASIIISGDLRALINVQRDLGSLSVSRDLDNALVRIGGSLGTGVLNDSTLALSARNVLESRVSVRDFLGAVTITSEMFDSAIMIGGDLGADGDFGGTGLNADIVSTGFASTVTVGGNFLQSDLIEGALRGSDGFFGTGDDSVAEGRGIIGLVDIAGTEVGSTRFTESYRVFSTGQLEGITIGGDAGEDRGNFAIVDAETLPDPIRVLDLLVTQASRIYTAEIQFNQAIDASTLSGALSVREVRGTSGSVQIFLIEGDDYTITYDEAQNRASILFDRDITSRDLPQLAGVPGQGIYRFELNADILRGQVTGARLDGNGNGFAEANDDFSSDDIVGDAGDKLIDNTVTVRDLNGNPLGEVDFYSPISLDVVFDNNFEPDGLPDANTVFTIRGAIGDHPDHDIDFFGFVNDVDVYSITLQAGQILRIGPAAGSGALAPITLLNEDGSSATGGLDFNGDPLPSSMLLLPASPIDATDLTFEQNYLVQQTKTYLVAVGPASGAIPFPNAVPNVDSNAGIVGDYRFTLEVFDDGDTGFADNVDSGDGQNVVNAPNAQSFAGPDGILNTDDDFNKISIGEFTFTANAGADGTLGTNDDLISGNNANGITSTRTGRGILSSTIQSSIGPANHSGIPGDVFADLDIFHLNNGNNIARGTVLQITIKLAQSGGDLGSRIADALTFDDFSNSVEFGVFETTSSTGLRDAKLLFSPTDFSPNGGETGVLAENGSNRFGFDENGDFFIQFVAPGKLGGSGGASYAVYLQGAFNTDYAIEVLTLGNATAKTRSQNFFIETEGGSIDWLRAGGLVAELNGFDIKVLGLTGTDSQGTPLGQVVLDSLITTLESLYADLGLDVNFSTNPADFEFEDFSTIYLSSSPDPVNPIFAELDFFGLQDFFQGLGLVPTLLSQPFQVAEHSDPFNTDSQDEGVVFLPTFARLGYSPSEADIQDLVDSLTAATVQTANELLGLRHTSANGIDATLFDVNASDAAQIVPGDGDAFVIPTIDRALSDPFDTVSGTDFWLGDQNASDLLERILSTI